jgi:hypothetical protein
MRVSVFAIRARQQQHQRNRARKDQQHGRAADVNSRHDSTDISSQLLGTYPQPSRIR